MISILKVLVQNDRQYSMNELSERLDISTKTLAKDLKELNYYLSDIEGLYVRYQCNNEKIETNVSIEDFVVIQSTILLDALIVKFIFELLETPNKDINYYSDKLYTSKSSVYRMINEFNDYFSAYQIRIGSEGTLYSIHCKDEYNYRRFVTGLFLEVYGNDVLRIMDREMCQLFKARLLHMYHANKVDISDDYIAYYSLFYFISLTREREGHHVEYSPHFIGQDVEVTDTEIGQLNTMNLLVETQRLHAIESTIYICNYALSSAIQREDIRVITELLDTIYTQYHLDERDHYVFNMFMDVYLALKYYSKTYAIYYDRIFFFVGNIKKEHRHNYVQLKELLASFEDKTGISFAKYEDYLIYILAITHPSILNHIFYDPILVVSEISIEHAAFLSDYIKEKLQLSSVYIDNLTWIDAKDIDTKEPSEFAFILSDVPLAIENNIVVDMFPFFDEQLQEIKNHLLS